jgi:hypothetical protein
MKQTRFAAAVGLIIGMIVASFAVSVRPLAAQESSPLVIENLNGALISANQARVSGYVRNRLPWEVRDVHVTITFLGTSRSSEASTTIDQIGSLKVKSFALTHTITLDQTQFSAAVTSFKLRTDDVDGMLTWFFQSNDPVIRTAIVDAFNYPSDEAKPALEECITLADRSSVISQEDLLSDTLCLNGLLVLTDGEAVEPVLHLMALYQQQSLDPWMAMSLAFQSSDPTLFDDLALVKAMPSNASYTSADVFEMILKSIGEAGLPALVQSTASDDPATRQMAGTVLKDLGKTDLVALLAEPDSTRLDEIIRAIATANYQDPVIPLLELAVASPSHRSTVESSLTALGGPAVPRLVDALSHPQQAVADLAESILRAQGDTIVPLLEIELPSEEPWSSTPAEADALISALRDWAVAQLTVQAEPLREQCMALFEAGDCAGAADLALQILAVRDSVPFAGELAPILTCEASRDAAGGDYLHALELGQRAEQLSPEDTTLHAQLVAWHIAQGDREYAQREYKRAWDHYQEALKRNKKSLGARQGTGRIVLHQNKNYLAVLGLVVIVFLIRPKWFGRVR